MRSMQGNQCCGSALLSVRVRIRIYFLPQCGSGCRKPEQCESKRFRIRILFRVCRHLKVEFYIVSHTIYLRRYKKAFLKGWKSGLFVNFGIISFVAGSGSGRAKLLRIRIHNTEGKFLIYGNLRILTWRCECILTGIRILGARIRTVLWIWNDFFRIRILIRIRLFRQFRIRSQIRSCMNLL
jgi:hypothetical protein